VEFDSGRSIQAPILLAFPLGTFALLSVLHEPRFTPERLTGSTLLVIGTLALALLGSTRQRLQLRPISRQLVVSGEVTPISPDAYLELDCCDPLNSDFSSFPYELRILDGSGLRQVLLRSKLVPLLNDLRRLRDVWQANVSLGSSLPSTFYDVLTEKSELAMGEDWGNLSFSATARQNQDGIVSILTAIALFALSVGIFLVTGQLSSFGQISALGYALAAMLVIVPLAIAVHLNLGRVQVHFEKNILRVEIRRGVFAKKISRIPRNELRGAWWIENGTERRYELLLLWNNSFCSFAIDDSAVDHRPSAFVRMRSSISSQI
jgi:hypothetical protein